MLKRLKYSVEFPTTGRSFANEIDFAPGLTSITGRNEAGKTVVLEMIGYCLFGKAALRGAASDYRNLVASLSLFVNAQEVVISRARKETLTVGGKEVAVGAEALNRSIPALLGFGLDVFNIACAAQQGDIGALTEMKPTARRQMVDKLMGLDQLEVIEKDCRDESRAKGQLASSLAMSITAPEAPVKPDDYEDSGKLRTLIATVETLERERLDLMRVQEPVRPEKPQAPPDVNVAELEQYEAQRQTMLQDRARIEGQLAGIPKPTVSREDMERAVAYELYREEVERRGLKPEHSIPSLEDFTLILDAQAKQGEAVNCPNCDHHFHVGLTPDEEDMARRTSPLTSRQIVEQYQRHEAWAEPLEEVEEYVIADIEGQISAWTYRNLRQELEDSLAVPQLEDKSAELRVAREYQQAEAVWKSQMDRYIVDFATYREAQKQLADWPDRSEELEQLRLKLAHAQSYEQALATYERNMTHYDTVMDQAQKAREEADGFTSGARALSETRVAVKAELAPSLSRAASGLLASMTNGERRSVVVDEDFEVVVDGQPLRTLSGSGKSVVNLALRIGMGQVLTSRVLPIFLGDEIDAAMDNDRAGTTHETMKTLREYLHQIILVTHKDMEADNTIELQS
jgi:DNA repair protein SbcC/Rad50